MDCSRDGWSRNSNIIGTAAGKLNAILYPIRINMAKTQRDRLIMVKRMFRESWGVDKASGNYPHCEDEANAHPSRPCPKCSAKRDRFDRDKNSRDNRVWKRR